MSGEPFEKMLWKSVQSLLAWVERCNYRGYEPFDALLSPLGRLACGNSLAERLFIQAVRQCPVNLRPLIGIKPHESSMGRGCMAAGHLYLYQCTGLQEHRESATACLKWLIENRSPLSKEYAWGHHFDWTSRAGRQPMHMPIIVWTSLAGHTFLDAYEVLGAREYFEVARSVCRWIMALPRETTDRGTCISYVSFRQDSIHNSNMLGASLLARYAAASGDEACMDLAREAMRYSCERQLPEGGWYYGEAPMHRWIDNFHTGYNLDSLKQYLESSGSREYEAHLDRGYRYYVSTFFDEDGRPRYYDRQTYPIDIQCASQAVTTLANFVDREDDAYAWAEKVARWTIAHMQDQQGYFYYRRFPAITVKTPMLHWGQGTMFKGLAALLLAGRRKGTASELKGTGIQTC